ncbi:MAG: glycosyltransferase [Clostridia bacterium]|nr:glycosyltransferase [Clostridia bacterium]
MFFSVLVPVYNTSKYLCECVDSILSQTFRDFEILLLDDGSTDNSGEICDRYAAENECVRVIHKENEGLMMTRRRGFREAKGDFFICVDSDDYVSHDLLERVTYALKETGADMVMYNFEYFNGKGEHNPSRLKIADGSLYEGDSKQYVYERKLLTVDFNMMWMRAVKREIVDIDADYSDSGIRNMCEDALQVLPLYTNAKRIVYLDAPLYYYRKGDDSITGKTTVENWRATQILFSHTEKYLDIWRVSEEIRSRFYTNHLEHLCNYVRWMFSVCPDRLPCPLKEMIEELREEHGFVVSRKHYKRKYSHSLYLSITVPLISRLVSSCNIKGLRFVTGIEKKLMKIKN